MGIVEDGKRTGRGAPHVQARGGGAEPLLALHGSSNQHRVLGGVVRSLSHVDGLVALDLRGRGGSAKPPLGSYGRDAHAEDVIRTSTSLG